MLLAPRLQLAASLLSSPSVTDCTASLLVPLSLLSGSQNIISAPRVTIKNIKTQLTFGNPAQADASELPPAQWERPCVAAEQDGWEGTGTDGTRPCGTGEAARAGVTLRARPTEVTAAARAPPGSQDDQIPHAYAVPPADAAAPHSADQFSFTRLPTRGTEQVAASLPRGSVHCVRAHAGITGSPASPGPQGWQTPGRGSIVSPAHTVSPTGTALAVQHPALPWPPASGKVTASTAKATGRNQGHVLLAILILFF